MCVLSVGEGYGKFQPYIDNYIDISISVKLDGVCLWFELC